MKIAVVGAHKSKLSAPFDDLSWNIWTCSNRNESELPRYDVWFELHDMESADIRGVVGPVYLDYLKHLNVFMQKSYPEYPNADILPLGDLIEEFGEYFFTGTVSYMLAMAVIRKPEAIGLWGFGDCPEYHQQKFSIFHFVQMAKDRGIKVINPPSPPPLYAYAR